jgi:hypothetical protein
MKEVVRQPGAIMVDRQMTGPVNESGVSGCGGSRIAIAQHAPSRARGPPDGAVDGREDARGHGGRLPLEASRKRDDADRWATAAERALSADFGFPVSCSPLTPSHAGAFRHATGKFQRVHAAGASAALATQARLVWRKGGATTTHDESQLRLRPLCPG